MNQSTKLEGIRRKCIEANPEIVVGLKPSGLIQRGPEWPVDTIVTLHVDFKSDRFEALLSRPGMNITFDLKDLTREEVEAWRVLPRTIRLADVLLAISEAPKSSKLVIDDYGVFWDMNSLENSTIQPHPFNWDLRNDDLEKQSPECIDFISSVLGVV